MGKTRLLKISRRWAVINLVAAFMMFSALIACFLFTRHFTFEWDLALKVREELGNFSPKTEHEAWMKKLLLHFSAAILIQKAEFFCLVLTTAGFGFFSLHSFRLIKKLVSELLKG